MSNHTYNYSPSCYVCNGLFDQTQLPKENTTTECPTIMNDYVCMKQTTTQQEPTNIRGNYLITGTMVKYRHRSHGEPGERPYKM
jgi:hypothetical protein